MCFYDMTDFNKIKRTTEQEYTYYRDKLSLLLWQFSYQTLVMIHACPAEIHHNVDNRFPEEDLMEVHNNSMIL